MSDFYPRWIQMPDGNKRVVQNNIEHGNVLGKKFDERAEEIDGPHAESDPRFPVPVPVMDFGAKGNGKTDDTPAIQKAVDSVATPDPIPVIPATADHPAVFKGEDGKLTIGKRSNLKPPVK